MNCVEKKIIAEFDMKGEGMQLIILEEKQIYTLRFIALLSVITAMTLNPIESKPTTNFFIMMYNSSAVILHVDKKINNIFIIRKVATDHKCKRGLGCVAHTVTLLCKFFKN